MNALAKAGGTSPIDRLLSRLEGVRETAPAQYAAKCPAHDDGSPSLSVRDLGDRVLIHCFAGCEPAEVMDAVDLSLAELFVQRENHGPMRRRERWDARALLKLLRSEAGIVLIAANDIAEGQTPKPDDYERLRVAVGRIVRVVGVAG